MTQTWNRIRAVVLGLLGIAAVVATWDAYKAFGPAEGVLVGNMPGLSQYETLHPRDWAER